MKRLLIAVLISMILFSVGIGLFIATFDIDQYRWLLVPWIESKIHSYVTVDRLSLQIRKGDAIIGLQNLSVYPTGGKDRLPFLTVDRADVSVAIAPLLSRRVLISSLSIVRPNAHLISTKDPKSDSNDYAKEGSPFPTSLRINTNTNPLSDISIGSVSIRRGTIRFQDMKSDPASVITVKNIDAKARSISMSGVWGFSAKMALASDVQNLTFSVASAGFASGFPYVKDFYMETDLSTLDSAELANASPILRRLGLRGPLNGAFRLKVREFELASSGISKLSADIFLAGAGFSIASIKTPVYGMDLSASCERDSIIVNSFSARLANSLLSGSGRLDEIFAAPQTELRLRFEVQGIKRFVFSVLGLDQNIDGNMRLTFDGTMKGRSWPEISKNLAGSGEFYLDRGMMMNTNVLNQTLGSLTLFPGLPDMVRPYVPEPIQQAFGNNDTTMEPLRQTFTIDNGYVIVPNLNLRTDTFDMRGEAKSSLTGDISGSGMIRFTRSVSDAMMKAVPEMKYITDNQGMIEFPMAFKSGEEGFKVIPDLRYVGKKVAVQKAGELVTDFLQKAVKNGSEAGAAGSSAAASGKVPKLKDIMKSLLDEH